MAPTIEEELLMYQNRVSVLKDKTFSDEVKKLCIKLWQQE